MKRFYRVLDGSLGLIVMAMVALMVLSISMEIALREVFSPLLGNPGWIARLSAPINTLSQTVLVWIGLLGSSLALRERAHLGIDALVRTYPRRVQIVLAHAGTTLVLLFSLAVLLIGGWLICQRSIQFDSKMPGFETLNRAWFYSVLVISGALNVLYCLSQYRHPRIAADENVPAVVEGDPA